MIFGTVKGGRDGRLVVVSKDRLSYALAVDIVPSLREALEDWARYEPLLRTRSEALNAGQINGQAVDPSEFLAPLPRAAGWLDGSTFVNHIVLMNRSMGKEMPPEMVEAPLMYQGGSDDMLGPRDPILLAQDQPWGIDFEAELGVITDDVPMQTSATDALSHIKLLVLINDVSLRFLQPRELALGFGMLQAKPSTGFAPFAVTPDELGGAWSDGRIDLVMRSTLNGKPYGATYCARGMLYGFGDLIAHATLSRRLSAGTIIGSGTISNEQPLETAFADEGGLGFSCISESRAVAGIRGDTIPPFMQFGDEVHIEAIDASGGSVFGDIEQQLQRFTGANG